MSAIPAAVPYTFWSTAIRRDICAALYFCNCELRWRSTVCSTPLFQRAAGYFCSYEVLCLRIPQIYVHYSGKLQPKTTSEESVCRIICRLTPENCGMAGGLSLCPFKKAATRAELPFHHRCRSRQTFGVAKNICANFPKYPRKTTFRPQRSLRPFYSVTSKKGLHVFFLQILGAIFWSQAMLSATSTRISGILSRFSTNQNFWWCACTPTSNNTAFHNIIAGNFVVYQDRLETNLLQLFGRPENSEWFSANFVVILRPTLLLNRNKHDW